MYELEQYVFAYINIDIVIIKLDKSVVTKNDRVKKLVFAREISGNIKLRFSLMG